MYASSFAFLFFFHQVLFPFFFKWRLSTCIVNHPPTRALHQPAALTERGSVCVFLLFFFTCFLFVLMRFASLYGVCQRHAPARRVHALKFHPSLLCLLGCVGLTCRMVLFYAVSVLCTIFVSFFVYSHLCVFPPVRNLGVLCLLAHGVSSGQRYAWRSPATCKHRRPGSNTEHRMAEIMHLVLLA